MPVRRPSSVVTLARAHPSPREWAIRRNSGGNSRYKRGSHTAGKWPRGKCDINDMTRWYVSQTANFRRCLLKKVVPASKGRNSMRAGHPVSLRSTVPSLPVSSLDDEEGRGPLFAK